MEEARRGEIIIKDIDQKTLGTVIRYIYTGELEIGENYDIQMLVRAFDKYDLPGMKQLLVNNMRKEVLNGENIADLIISAYRHEVKELKDLALDMMKANREVFKDEGFRQVMKQADPNIMLDIVNEL